MNEKEWPAVFTVCSTKQWKLYKFKIGTTWVWVNDDKFNIGINYPFSRFNKRDKKDSLKKKEWQRVERKCKRNPRLRSIKKERRKEEERPFLMHYKRWFTATFHKSEWLGLNDRHRKVSFLNERAKQKERKGWRGQAEVKQTHMWTVGHPLRHMFCLSVQWQLCSSRSSSSSVLSFWKSAEACFAVRWDSISSVVRVNKRKYSCSGPPG